MRMLDQIREFGDFLVFKRGDLAKQEGIPLYFVGRRSDGVTLEEFRRKADAIKWAYAQFQAG